MEDQGKRLLLAVAAAFAIMMLWTFLFPGESKDEEKKKGGDDAAQVDEQRGDDAPPPPGGDAPPPPGGDAPPPGGDAPDADEPADGAPALGPEQTWAFEFENFHAVVSSHGGAIKSWTLQGSQMKNGEGGPLQLVETGDVPAWRPFLIGFHKDSTVQIPALADWEGQKTGPTSLELSWSNEQLAITKNFEFDPDNYLVQVTVIVEKRTEEPAKQALRVSLFGYQDPEADTGGGWGSVGREWKAACNVGSIKRSSAKDLAKKGRKSYPGELRWAGFTHSYFLAAAAVSREVDHQFNCDQYPLRGRPGGMQVDVTFPVANLEMGAPYIREIVAYYGPSYLDQLESLSSELPFDPEFHTAVNLGDWIGFIARPLLVLLEWFHGFLGNWGLAIILLTFVVKLATLYWTTKSMRSMKAMSKLTPKVKELQKKYEDDKQRQQVEIMNLYKSHGVNPLAGCLPMILQMPIWFALYRMLMKAAELYQAPFIPGWIDDLTATDPFYILPIAVMGMMFLQAKLSPSTADSTQQKLMMYGLPLIFGVFSFFFPAGLVLYIFTNTCLTALHHVWMNRTDPGAPPPSKSQQGNGSSRSEDDAPAAAKKKSRGGKKGETGAKATESDADEGDGGAQGAAKGQAHKGAAKSGGANKKKPGQKKKRGKKKRGK